jgi:beta-mannosidase
MHLDLDRKPGISAKIAKKDGGEFEVILSTRHPALWAWLEIDGIDARLSDNFIHLRPGAPFRITAKPAQSISASELRKKLIVRSLVDTY